MSEPEWTELANDIRVVDGNHDLGAGALAAALTERGWTKREAREAAAGEALPCDAEVADDEGEHHCSLSPGHKPGDGGRHYSFIPADNHWCEGRTGHSDLPFGHWFRTARAREIAAGLAEIGTGGTPEFIRGYNAGYDDAYEHEREAREATAGEALRLREALERIGGRCHSFTKGRCWDYGRTIDAEYVADKWCDACIAHAALASEPTPTYQYPDPELLDYGPRRTAAIHERLSEGPCFLLNCPLPQHQRASSEPTP